METLTTLFEIATIQETIRDHFTSPLMFAFDQATTLTGMWVMGITFGGALGIKAATNTRLHSFINGVGALTALSAVSTFALASAAQAPVTDGSFDDLGYVLAATITSIVSVAGGTACLGALLQADKQAPKP